MKKEKKPPRLRRTLICGVFALIALFIIGVLAYCHITARIVHVERVTIVSEDVPPEFDGITILFVSDIDMVGLNGPRSVASLFDSLEKLQPDILILGGDYAGESLLNKLNSTGSSTELEEDRRRLFAELIDFPAPLGKYAVAGEEDVSAQLGEELSLGRISLLDNSATTVQLMGASISIVGLADDADSPPPLNEAAKAFDKDDFVILVTHNPSAISSVLTAEAEGGGQWCDIILSGHTHGGQMILDDRRLIKLTPQELRYDTGWSKETGVHILVSSGAGCDTVNLRLNTQAKVHLITLKRTQAFNFGN